MNRQQAEIVIQEFIKQGGSLFVDGCKGDRLPDEDVIRTAKDCLTLMEWNKGGEQNKRRIRDYGRRKGIRRT